MSVKMNASTPPTSGGSRAGGATISIPQPPRGWGRLLWLGPGFLWMVSAAGSGELLFTPRVGALYGYALLWALLTTVALKWFINREIGRFTVCTGATVLEGFRRLPGPRNWAVWMIMVPQLVVAVATIAGLAGSAATALVLMLPGDIRLWMTVWEPFFGEGRQVVLHSRVSNVIEQYLGLPITDAALGAFGYLLDALVSPLEANRHRTPVVIR